MLKMILFTVIAIGVLVMCPPVFGGKFDQVSDKIYVNYTVSAYCVKRLNGTHEIGCGLPPRRKSVGTLHLVETQADLDWIIEDGPHDPYVALIHGANFNRSTVIPLRDSGRVHGIIVLQNSSTSPTSFSPDKKCPGQIRGLYTNDSSLGSCQQGTQNWNPDGESLLFENFPFPMALIDDAAVADNLTQCYRSYNMQGADGGAPSYPLCGAQLYGTMYAARDSRMCYRRSNIVNGLTSVTLCDPIGDKNVFASLKRFNETGQKNDSVVMVTARMDAYSMFYSDQPSAGAYITSLVTLLATAHTLAGVKDDLRRNGTKDLVWVLFNGEAFDYMGSGRLVQDIEAGYWPTSEAPAYLESIAEILEVSQVAPADSPDLLFLHSDPLSLRHAATNATVDDMVSSFAVAAVSRPMAGSPLPPSSAMSFLKRRTVPALVLASHDAAFTNKFYMSRYDTAAAIGADYPSSLPANQTYDHVTVAAQRLADVASTLANALYHRVTTNQTALPLTANETLVTHLLYCYLYSGGCDLFQEVATGEEEADNFVKQTEPYTTYVGVKGHSHFNRIFTYRLLAYFLGDRVAGATKENCTSSEGRKYFWFMGPKNASGYQDDPRCVATDIGVTDASSLAFASSDAEDYEDWEGERDATWTESQWALDVNQLRTFLMPNPQWEVAVLSIGLAVMVLSLLITCVCNRKTSFIYTSTAAPTNYATDL